MKELDICDLNVAELEFYKDLGMPSGIAKNIFDLAFSFNSSALYKHPKFALACALTLYSAHAQAMFMTPTGSPVSLYQVIVAYSASGKNHFMSCVQNYVNYTRKELDSGEPRSEQALRFALTENRSKIWIHDEFILKVSKAFKKFQKDVAEEEKFELLLKLWGDCKLLPASVTKNERYRLEEVKNPRLSVFGTGTVDGLKTLLQSGDFATQGHASRFDFILSDEIKVAIPSEFLEGSEEKTNFKIIESIANQLKELSYMVIHFGKEKGQPDKWKSADAIVQLDFSDCGRQSFYKLITDTELYLNPALQFQNQESFSQAKKELATKFPDFEHSMRKRLNDKILRVASLNALSRGERVVRASDVDFANRVLRPNFEAIMAMLTKSTEKEENPIEYAAKKIEDFLSQKDRVNVMYTMRDLQHNLRHVRKLTYHQKIELKEFLASHQKVTIQKQGKTEVMFVRA